MDGVSVSGIRQAVDATLAAGDARVATYMSFDAPAPAEADARGVGVIDFANGRSQVTDRIITPRMLEESERLDSRLARRMKRGLSGSTELRFDGHGERTLQDPLWVLSLLTGANDDVAIAGACDVRGTATRHLRLTADFRRAAEETPGGLAMPDVTPRRGLRRPAPRAPERVPVEVWLDGDGRIRRASVAPLVRRGDERVVWWAIELWDFGRATGGT